MYNISLSSPTETRGKWGSGGVGKGHTIPSPYITTWLLPNPERDLPVQEKIRKQDCGKPNEEEVLRSLHENWVVHLQIFTDRFVVHMIIWERSSVVSFHQSKTSSTTAGVFFSWCTDRAARGMIFGQAWNRCRAFSDIILNDIGSALVFLEIQEQVGGFESCLRGSWKWYRGGKQQGDGRGRGRRRVLFQQWLGN